MNYFTFFFIQFALIFTSVQSLLFGKIYDCFPYMNEYISLKIRFRELYDVVDKFIIVESNETFQGNLKQFNFEKIRHQFAEYEDKIHYVKITKRLKTDNPWERRTYQVNHVLQGLNECGAQDHDVVIFSDVDEIPPKAHVAGLERRVKKGHRYVFMQKMYERFLNSRSKKTSIWSGTAMTTFQNISELTPEGLRRHARVTDTGYLQKVWAGWHFSSVYGKDLPELLYYKIQNICDKNVGSIYPMEDLILFAQNNLVIEEVNDSYPIFVKENIPYLRDNFFLVEK